MGWVSIVSKVLNVSKGPGMRVGRVSKVSIVSKVLKVSTV